MVQEHPNSRLLREGGLAFFGAVTASLSHEINNVLAIIGELSGLHGDLIQGAAAGRPPDPERLARISGRITEQVERGRKLVKRLNRFAHAVDQPVTEVSVNQTMELITAIGQRFAGLRKATLDTVYPAEELVIESSAFGLMQAAHLCIDLALAAGGDGPLTVTVAFAGAEDGGCTIDVGGTADVALEQRSVDRLSYLSLLMEELGGRVVCSPETDPRRFELHVPRKRSPGQAAQ